MTSIRYECPACGSIFTTWEGYKSHACSYRNFVVPAWENNPLKGKKEVRQMKLEELEKVASEARLGSQDLPDSFVGTVVAVEQGRDAEYDNRPHVLVTVTLDEVEGKPETVIKYTPYHLKAVARSLKGMGMAELTAGQRYLWVRKSFGIGFPRHVPTEKR